MNTRLAGEPLAGSYARGKLWVLWLRAGKTELVEVAPGTNRPTGRRVVIENPAAPYTTAVAPSAWPVSVARAGGSLWTIDRSTGEVVMVDPVTATVKERIDIGGPAGDIEYGPSGLWVTNTEPRSVTVDGQPGFTWAVVRLTPILRPGNEERIAEEITFGPGLGSFGPRELAVRRGRVDASWVNFERFRRSYNRSTDKWRGGGSDGWRMIARRGVLLTAQRYSCNVKLRGTPGVLPKAGTTPRARSFRMRPGKRCFTRALALGPGRMFWAGYRVGRTTPGQLVQRSTKNRRAVRRYKIGSDLVDIVSEGGRYVWALSRSDRRLTRVRVR